MKADQIGDVYAGRHGSQRRSMIYGRGAGNPIPSLKFSNQVMFYPESGENQTEDEAEAKQKEAEEKETEGDSEEVTEEK